MSLTGGAIAGIVIVSVAAGTLVIWGVYFLIKKRRENAQYLERCSRLWKKYDSKNRKPELVAKFPYADATFVRASVPGQQFTSEELKPGKTQDFYIPGRRATDSETADDEERRPIFSMHKPIDPDAINPRLYGSDQQAQAERLFPPSSQSRPSQVFFSLDFEESTNLFKVFVEQAKFLRPISHTNMCNPYCTVAVVPGYPERKSQVHRKTVDPVFQEEFSFPFEKSGLKQKSLQLKFFDFDQYSRHECIGVVLQKLDEFPFDSRIDLWRKVTSTSASSGQVPKKAGDLLLRLGYLPSAEKLTVVLLKARFLKEVGGEEDKRPPDPYVRVAVLHEGMLLKKKKTSTKKKTSNPTYNQAINFAVPLHLLPQIEIQFHVVNETGSKVHHGDKKEIIGSLEIGLHSTGEELQHWRDLMSNKPQARWHHLVATKNEDKSSASGHRLARDDSDDEKFSLKRTT